MMTETLSYYSTILYRDFAAYTSRRLQELERAPGLRHGAEGAGRRPAEPV